MVSLFSRLKSKDSSRNKKKNAANDAANAEDAKPKWDDAWTRKTVEPEEIHELIRCCTIELKARGLDLPFLLLPFRPTSDPSAVRTFIRHFFDQSQPVRGETLLQELRMAEPMVISGVAKWCWSRLQGGVVGWDAYELFKVGEFDSNMARDSFRTFIPISVENGARQRIIFDFFDLMAAIAAHGKSNGLGGRKLSRMAAWWAFEQKDTGNGFEGGYNAWLSAADATSHLFFAYLRSLAPEQNLVGISLLPMSLQKLVQETEYPPQRPDLLLSATYRVVMVVENVSPTPFALLRRANHFQYRDSDRGLQEFSEFEDPVKALTEECRRVLKAVSAANQSQVSSSKHSTSLRDASWSRFEDIGFSSTLDDDEEDDDSPLARKPPQGLRTTPASGNDLGRPTTPSWADFLSSGFIDDNQTTTNLLLPPDKVLPPIDTQSRQHSSQSHKPRLESNRDLEPGELANITVFDLDDSFWWVWMSSLAPEETPERKSAFGRCAVVETKIRNTRWLVMEEMVQGAAPEPKEGAYIAEKKGFFSWTRRGKTLNRNKSVNKQGLDRGDKDGMSASLSKTSIGPDTHARIQAKAAQLRAAGVQEKQRPPPQRRGRTDADILGDKTHSVLTMQSNIVGEASSAMKWVKKYDKGSIKDAYMANSSAGRGMALSPVPTEDTNGYTEHKEPLQESFPEPTPETKPEPRPEPKLVRKPEPRREPKPELAPQVPQKDPVPPPPAPVEVPQEKPLPADQPVEESPEPKADKAAEAGVHPAERPLPEEEDRPVGPRQESLLDALRDTAVSPEPATVSPESKKTHNKLQKEKEKGGLRKLFSRKNRASKAQDNATSTKTTIQEELPTPEPPAQQSPTPEAAPSPSKQPEEPQQAEPISPVDSKAEPMTEAMTPVQEEPSPVSKEQPAQVQEIPNTSPDVAAKDTTTKETASLSESLSRVDTKDAAEANKEFSRFDQGPLADQPAFIPDDDDGDATPPPITRRPAPQSTPSTKSAQTPPPKEEKLSNTAGPGVQDRWAQIRKNAAERAVQRERETNESNRTWQPKPAEGEDDTSGEETIESRVARIKARVAELTGNIENSNGPQNPQQTSPVRRP